MPSHHDLANLIWQIADLLRGPYRPPQYERVRLPMTVLRRFDCMLVPTRAKVLAEHERRKGGTLNDDASLEREVRPHVPDAWMGRSKDTIGDEIDFNRRFYTYTPPRPLGEIDADLKRAEEEVVRLLREVTA